MRNWLYERDPDILSESALGVSQAMMGNALAESRMEDSVMAGHMGQDVAHLLSGDNDDLTVKDLGRFLAICGFRLSVDIRRIPNEAGLPATPVHRDEGVFPRPPAPLKGVLVPILA